MNERIRELAHQADLVIKKSNGNDFRFGAMDLKLEKFANGMINEVVEFIHKDYLRDYDMDSRKSLLTALKEHFGVE